MNDKPKLSKGIIAAFAIMGTVIVALAIALIVSINSKPDNPTEISVQGDSTTSSTSESVADEPFSSSEGNSTVPTITNPDVNPPSSSSVTSTGDTSAPQSEQQSSQSNPQSSVPQQSSSATQSAESKPVSSSTPPEQSEPTGEGVTLKYSIDNSWESGNVLMYGLQFGITNNTGSPISNWTLVMNIDGLNSCTGWNATYTASGNTLTVTNDQHNGSITNGGTIVFGCNLGSAKSFKITSATLNGIPCTVTAGYVNQNDQSNQNNQNNQQNNNQQQNNQQNATTNVSELLKRPENAVQGDDWLFTDGNRIVDKNGKRVWLTGVNWFGYNTGTNTFDGLWNSQLEPSVKAIADHGFNLIRVPISAELINQWAAGEYPKANYNNAYNTALNSMNSLEIFDYFLALAEQNGIKVMPDIHSAETNASGHNVNLWYTSKISAEEFYSALEWMADRYKDNDTIIAYDLKNEPHGKPFEGDGAAIWNNSKDANNWKYTAEVAAARILAKNPNVLILVEGTEIYPIDIKNNSDFHSTDSKDYYFNWWGGNLRGVKDFPVNLGKYQNKLVYSPHDYGPTVYQQPWFEGDYTFDSLMEDCWKDNWFYIHEENTAPLLIGEWGGFMKEPNLKWMTYMRKLIKDNKLNHTFWCFNANSGDTGGLVLDDFKTWDEEKYAFVKEVLWQENGKFVGLDHAIPLGENGITLAKASGIQ